MRIIVSLMLMCLTAFTVVIVPNFPDDITVTAHERNVEEVNEIFDEDIIPSPDAFFLIPELTVSLDYFKDLSGSNPTRRVLIRPPKYLA